MHNYLKILSFCLMSLTLAHTDALALDHPGATTTCAQPDAFALIENNTPAAILIDAADQKGVSIAAANLANDFQAVSGQKAEVIDQTSQSPKRVIVAGTIGSKHIAQLAKKGLVNTSALKGKTEMYQISFVENPWPGVDEALVIAGSDRRGAIYGIYEISEQIGVSPWYYWADAPVQPNQNLYMAKGNYTAGEPAVRYRGIFLNDEAPCLTSWVGNTFGTNYGGKDFYAKVFELLLRLRANYLWPAMWGWAFYADDPENSDLADEMGIIMGTSHHEPMARNHQEWARHRNEYGAWDYNTNQQVIDQFFREGVKRIANKEDIITIGMRGDGDAPMGGEEGNDHNYISQDEANLRTLEKVIANQRKIIAKETGRPASEHPQLWALYKEVQKYYDMGLKVPDDVIILIADDNWGNIRRVPTAEERKHKGGWGMYYHVDYVGAPRNSKWLNCTPIQNLWEQMTLCHEYGIDKLWILNVGDLKPMEYPITLFLNLAWNPDKYTAETLLDHTADFCSGIFGPEAGPEAARILNLYCKYAGRCTPEMLDQHTYNIENGDWRQARDEFLVLETEALRLRDQIAPEAQDSYKQLILFPVQAMANLYDMYYSTAMNHRLYDLGDAACNDWADRAERAFARDAALCQDYNKVMAGGKWDGMMTQKHIGYSSWNDNFPADVCPEQKRIDNPAQGGFKHIAKNGVITIEPEHYTMAQANGEAQWTVIPYMGRTLSAVTLMPRTAPTDGCALEYAVDMPAKQDSVQVHIVVRSTLPFLRLDGHRYRVGFKGGEMQTVNFNQRLTEDPENVYSVMYPTVARRVVESIVNLDVPGNGEEQTLVIEPIEPGTVFEKIVIDCGGYEPSYLFMPESPMVKQ